MQNKIIFRGEQIVVPSTLRHVMVKKLHNSHMGVEACLHRAREVFHWPLMSAEVKDYVTGCSVCNLLCPEQAREPLVPHELALV